ncbi:MAG: hypothetical protein GY820_02215 [Gammaproteobacteria bacterium]|nr:hypothetical protein [Gammaproteobacteria bacterium]
MPQKSAILKRSPPRRRRRRVTLKKNFLKQLYSGHFVACAQRAQPQNGDKTEDQSVWSLLLGWVTV